MAHSRIPGVETARRLYGEVRRDVRAILDTHTANNPAGTNLHRPDGGIIPLGSEEWLLGPGRDTFSKATLLDHRGEVDNIHSLKDFEGNHYWAFAPLSVHTMMTGHYYLALNCVGSFPNYSVKQALELMGANINHLFPFGGASGGTGTPLKVGDELHLNLRYLSNVDVVYTCISFFTLRTQIIHPLVGIAVHGVFHDKASGALWMFQEGFGYPMDYEKAEQYMLIPGYGVFDQLRGTLVNYDPARLMWVRFAENMAGFLRTNPRALS